MSLELSIVIPAHNEGPRLDEGFARLWPVLEALGTERLEVIVVDDGSDDDTGSRAATICSSLPHFLVIKSEHNEGKGAALKHGIAVARGSHVIITDADMSIHPEQIPLLITALGQHDVAVGSRATSGAITYDSALRTRAGSIFNFLVRRWTGTTVRDTQCGFKGFQLGVARLFAILGHIDGFAFDAEWLHLAHRLHLSVESVPVHWDDVAGSSVRIGRDSYRMLRDIRGISQEVFRTVAVVVPAGVDLDTVSSASRRARLQGGVIARGSDYDLVVLPRDGGPAGLGIAVALSGELKVIDSDDLRGRRLEAF